MRIELPRPGIWLLLGCLSVLSLCIRAADTRPNILFFLADDQRNDLLGCAGHPVVKTPTIDRLATDGLRFENAFVTTPICAASRASILTGLYERTHGFTFGRPPVSRAHAATSYPAQLKKAGYRSGYIGKSHAQFQEENAAFAEMFDVYQPVSSKQYLIPWKDGKVHHETELCGDLAVEFIRSVPEDQPFVLSVAFFAAHAVDHDHRLGHHFEPLPELKETYAEGVVPAPRLDGDGDRLKIPEFLRNSMNRDRWRWRWDTGEKYDSNMRDYYRLISGIDRTVARVLETLQERGLDQNTVIIYAADNGYMMGDRGMAGKWNHYEQSLRVPLIVYDPRVTRGNHSQVRDEMALNIDLAPTILDFAGVPSPDAYQGASLRLSSKERMCLIGEVRSIASTSCRM